jgi:hypothetical protein
MVIKSKMVKSYLPSKNAPFLPFQPRLSFPRATNIKRDTFRHFVPIAIPQSRVEAGFKPAPTG